MDDFLSALIVGECVVFGALLLVLPAGNGSAAKRWLAAAFAVIGTSFVASHLIETGDGPVALIGRKMAAIHLLLGPVLYLSADASASPHKPRILSLAPHFLPFLVFVLTDTFLYGPASALGESALYESENLTLLVRDVMPIHVAAYLLFALGLLGRHKRRLKLVAADLDPFRIIWLEHFLLVAIIPLLLWLNDALSLFGALVPLNRPAYAVCIGVAGLLALRQGLTFPDHATEALFGDEEEEVAPRPRRGVGAQSSNALESYRGVLELLMDEKKPHLDPELTLPGLASALGLGVHDASRLINDQFGVNFYTFINRRRVEEAKRLMGTAAGERLNLLGIAHESGFNSKTAFNTAFRKFAGCTPSEYRREHVRLDKCERLLTADSRE